MSRVSQQSSEVRSVLRDERLRALICEYSTCNMTFSRKGVLAGVPLPVLREAFAVMRARIERKAARLSATACREVPAGRIAERQRTIQDKRLQAVGMSMAHYLHACIPLVQSKYGGIVPGRGGKEVVEWDRYSKRTKYPCKYRNAGVLIEYGRIDIQDSRGKTIFSHTITDADRLTRNPTRQAELNLGMVDFGSQNGGIMYRKYVTDDATILVGHPTIYTNDCRLLFADSTTPQVIDCEFGKPLRKRETEADRVAAAVLQFVTERMDKAAGVCALV